MRNPCRQLPRVLFRSGDRSPGAPSRPRSCQSEGQREIVVQVEIMCGFTQREQAKTGLPTPRHGPPIPFPTFASEGPNTPTDGLFGGTGLWIPAAGTRELLEIRGREVGTGEIRGIFHA